MQMRLLLNEVDRSNIQDQAQARTWDIPDNAGPLTIGRATSSEHDCDHLAVAPTFAKISRTHCTLTFNEGRVFIHDGYPGGKKSSWGILLNGNKTLSSPLKAGDQIVLYTDNLDLNRADLAVWIDVSSPELETMIAVSPAELETKPGALETLESKGNEQPDSSAIAALLSSREEIYRLQDSFREHREISQDELRELARRIDDEVDKLEAGFLQEIGRVSAKDNASNIKFAEELALLGRKVTRSVTLSGAGLVVAISVFVGGHFVEDKGADIPRFLDSLIASADKISLLIGIGVSIYSAVETRGLEQQSEKIKKISKQAARPRIPGEPLFPLENANEGVGFITEEDNTPDDYGYRNAQETSNQPIYQGRY